MENSENNRQREEEILRKQVTEYRVALRAVKKRQGLVQGDNQGISRGGIMWFQGKGKNNPDTSRKDSLVAGAKPL